MTVRTETRLAYVQALCSRLRVMRNLRRYRLSLPASNGAHEDSEGVTPIEAAEGKAA